MLLSVHEEIMVMRPIPVFAATLARLQLPMPCSQRFGEALWINLQLRFTERRHLCHFLVRWRGITSVSLQLL